VSAWVKTSTAGSSILTKNNGSGWASGNTIFYLGDGTAGGSGGIPSAVRYAGGFYQGSTSAAAVNNNAWRHVTYTNTGRSCALYVDGVAQPLSPGNAGFGNTDLGSIVRLGVSTNTFAGDGTVNFNGLLDSVQFFNQALSGPQIAVLHEGGSPGGSLPTTTDLTVAGGAALALNGLTQQIGSLSGPAGSGVLLGAGQLIVNSTADSAFGGTISGGGGSLVKSGTGTLTLTGANTYTGGTEVIGGTLRVNNASGSGVGAGPTTIGQGGTLAGLGTIGGNLHNEGVVHPGADADGLAVLGDFAQQSTGFLSVELASTSTFDRLTVTAQATLAGTLRLALGEGFVPGPASFDILDWGSRLGSFDSILSPIVPGFAWDFSQLDADGIVSLVAAGFEADFDVDGDVDGEDLPLWQAGYGTGATRGHGDADGDADVDGNDFLVWQRQLGSGTTPAVATVPEPASLTLALPTAVALLGSRRKKHR
jgi:autotransporter-associated beta strand protein